MDEYGFASLSCPAIRVREVKSVLKKKLFFEIFDFRYLPSKACKLSNSSPYPLEYPINYGSGDKKLEV